MTATLDAEVAELRRANAELQRKLDARTAERDEGEAQKAATAEILQIINASPGDLAPVFEAILDKAHSLCGATRGTLFLFDGQMFRATAMHGYPPPAKGTPPREISVSEDPRLAALLAGERLIHVPDLTQVDDSIARAVAERGGVRTNLLLPLRKDDALLGVISCNRHEVRPFLDNEIALLESFAAQAVLAMENARLITETREALDQQTATAEVLQVINASPGDLVPVFDALLDRAIQLCDAAYGHLRTYDGEGFPLVGVRGDPRFVELMQNRAALLPGPHHPVTRFVHGEDIVHFADAAQTDAYRNDDRFRGLVDSGACRALLAVALRKDGALLGYINVYREVAGAFSDKQIALLQNFAAQAVIAMENARLITETREALDQQTATAEVLQVINSSPGNLTPVFDAMLDKAMRLCSAQFGQLGIYDGDVLSLGAVRGPPEIVSYMKSRGPVRPIKGNNSTIERLARGENVIHVADARDDDAYREGNPNRRALVDLGGCRTLLNIALRKDRLLLGTIEVYRQEIRPFTDKEIALLQNFAAQAVIAIENTRLITETQEALDRQTATAEVLQVINSSPGDLTPVFDAMLEKALNLCEAVFGVLWTYDGERLRVAASRGNFTFPKEILSDGISSGPESRDAMGRLMRGEPIVHISDILEDADTASANPLRRLLLDMGGRTLLAAPLRKDAAFLGYFAIYRRDVRPFSEKQIALIQNFAAQAVIAMENARLITETREARDDAEAALGHLKAAQANLVQKEKMASLGQLTAGIAHEIKNPLNFVNNFADLSVELLSELKETAAQRSPHLARSSVPRSMKQWICSPATSKRSPNTANGPMASSRACWNIPVAGPASAAAST